MANRCAARYNDLFSLALAVREHTFKFIIYPRAFNKRQPKWSLALHLPQHSIYTLTHSRSLANTDRINKSNDALTFCVALIFFCEWRPIKMTDGSNSFHLHLNFERKIDFCFCRKCLCKHIRITPCCNGRVRIMKMYDYIYLKQFFIAFLGIIFKL